MEQTAIPEVQMVNAQIRLGDYATTPLYNIKAVVQATGISPSTLRAWERRYNMCRPQRSESGYRLYSDRDVAIIRWLKAQVDAGMAISQAVAWLDSLGGDDETHEQGILPTSGAMQSIHAGAGLPTRESVRSFEALRVDLSESLMNFDEIAAEQVMSEAFALYPLEQVGEQVVTPVLIDVGERWHRNEISITREHFATNYLLHRLTALLRTVPNLEGGPLLWVGCAPGELHEGGAVLLAIYLRRAGYQIHYLGQNLPIDDFVGEVRRRQPAMVLLSASTSEAAHGLRRMADELAHIEMPRPIIGYGGRIFIRQPDLRSQIAGVYLGDSAQEAVDTVGTMLHETHATTMGHASTVGRARATYAPSDHA
ncbi:MAG: MerR family transcriptional regulator [Caldilineaceae bacterium]